MSTSQSAAQRARIQQRIQQGIAAWEANAYLEALEAFNDVVREQPGFADVHNRIGLCKAMLGNSEGALQSLERALELAPTYAEAHFNLGIVLNELGRHGEAEAALRRAEELDTRDRSPFPSDVGHQIANAHARVGDLYMQAEAPRDAAAQYRAALAVRPRFQDLRLKLARALLAAGDAEGARSELEALLEGEPGFTEARLTLGVALQRLGDRQGAVREWRHVQSQRPGDRRVQAFLASAGAEA